MDVWNRDRVDFVGVRMKDEDLHRICQEVADEYQMGGLAGTVYEEYAIDVAKRALLKEREDLLEQLKPEIQKMLKEEEAKRRKAKRR